MHVLDFTKRTLRFVRSFFFELIAALRPYLVYGLKFSKGCRVHHQVRLRVTDGGACTFGENVVIERFSEVTAGGGNLTIGNNSFIGQGTIIVSKANINIGNNCLIAEQVTIRDHNHKIDAQKNIKDSGFEIASIQIGDNVWIGAKVCILAGVTIGEGSVIGAGSVVTRSIPSNAVAAGVPAKTKKCIKSDVVDFDYSP